MIVFMQAHPAIILTIVFLGATFVFAWAIAAAAALSDQQLERWEQPSNVRRLPVRPRPFDWADLDEYRNTESV